MRSSLRPAVHASLELYALELDTWAPAELLSEPMEAGQAAAAPPEADAEAEQEQDTALATAAELELERERAAEEAARRAHEKALADAYERGLAEGRAEGEQAASELLRAPMTAVESALAALRAGEERWAGALEDNICALAVAVARHIIGREVAADPGVVRALVRGAVAEFPADQPLRIRVCPQDLTAITAQGLTEDSLGRSASWTADPTLSPGECVVEGRERIVDGRIDTALERVYRGLSQTHV
jgi:flagellar biosynthesis/type III secretory pathway protein FliH